MRLSTHSYGAFEAPWVAEKMEDVVEGAGDFKNQVRAVLLICRTFDDTFD